MIEAIAPCRMRHTNHPKFAATFVEWLFKRNRYTFNIRSQSTRAEVSLLLAPKRDSRVAEPPNALPARHGAHRAPHSEADAMRAIGCSNGFGLTQ